MTVDGEDVPSDGVPAGGKRRQRHLQQASILRVYSWIALIDGAAGSVEYMDLAEPMLQLTIEPDPNVRRGGGQGRADAGLGSLWECVPGRRGNAQQTTTAAARRRCHRRPSCISLTYGSSGRNTAG